MTKMKDISTQIPEYLADYVAEYKKLSGISKSRIITDALKEYLKGKLNKEF